MMRIALVVLTDIAQRKPVLAPPESAVFSMRVETLIAWLKVLYSQAVSQRSIPGISSCAGGGGGRGRGSVGVLTPRESRRSCVK